MKFNTNGAVMGPHGQAGICSVLKDHNGAIVVKFSKSIGLSDPVSAELNPNTDADRTAKSGIDLMLELLKFAPTVNPS
ncbi:hypothetical protein F3Y22_tig00111877pilonHSYRG00410 [Hibiscus syriacus]|uniref:Uncharacterized protein n=1 Tax=Hibiscus syriacus TaxID=106335 RepID=A0A6A2X9A4_HIBSY|nr:hypothetical protein F3Y22_tig00111877pilonHSYRG00410 [Hibiscus syriacus]